MRLGVGLLICLVLFPVSLSLIMRRWTQLATCVHAIHTPLSPNTAWSKPALKLTTLFSRKHSTVTVTKLKPTAHLGSYAVYQSKAESFNASIIGAYPPKTHNCGHLNQSHEGRNVTLCGWLVSKRCAHIYCYIDFEPALIVQRSFTAKWEPPSNSMSCKTRMVVFNLS